MSNLIDAYLKNKKGSNLVKHTVKNAVKNASQTAQSVLGKAAAAKLQSTTPTPEVSKTPYEDAYEKGKGMYEQGATEQKKYLEDSYKEQITGINKDYDRTANQAYVQYRQNQKALPGQLSRLGMTGGASENAILKLQTAYGGNLADNEFNRGKALSDARTRYNDSVNNVNTTLNQNLASAYNSALQQDTAYGIQQAETARLEAKEAKEKAEAKAEAKAVDEHNKLAMAEVAALRLQGYEVDVQTDSTGRIYYNQLNNTKEQQATIDAHNNAAYAEIAALKRQGFEVYTWTGSDGKVYYQKLNKENAQATAIDKVNNERQREAAKLQAQGYEVYTWTDERGYFHYQKGQKKTNDVSTSGSGGSRGSGGGGGGNNDDDDDPAVDDSSKENETINRYNQLSTNLANAMLKDSSATARAYWGVKLDEAYKNGELTKSQYQKLIKSIA